LARLLRSTARHLGIDGRDLGFRHRQSRLELLWIEAGEEITGFDFGADVDRPRQNLAGDAKADLGLVAWLDITRQLKSLARLARLDGHRAHRPDDLRGTLSCLRQAASPGWEDLGGRQRKREESTQTVKIPAESGSIGRPAIDPRRSSAYVRRRTEPVAQPVEQLTFNQ
jgi:hypothetical protein